MKKDLNINGDVIKLGPYVLRGKDLYQIEKDKEKKTEEEKFVCHGVKVKKVVRDLENGDVDLVLEFWSFDRWKETQVSRGKLFHSEIPYFLKCGMDVAGNKGKHAMAFIDLHEKKFKTSYFHNSLGWGNFNGDLIYKHYKAIKTTGMFSDYKGNFQVEPKGKLKDWRQVILEQVIGHPPLELILCAGFSAAIVGLLNVSQSANVDSLLFHMAGNSTTGKTTSAMLAVSPFGNPSMNNNGLIQSYNGTKNAMVKMLAGNFGVPIVYDETSMNRMGSNNLSSFLYELAQNKERARLDKESNLKEISTWGTSIISTGEHSVIKNANANEGIRVRLFEFMNVEWTKNAKNADQLKEVLSHNYGHAGLTFIKYLQKIGVSQLLRMVSERKAYVAERMPKSAFLDRIAGKFAIVLTAGDIANQALKLDLSIDEIADLLVEQEMTSLNERAQGPKFHERLKYLLLENKQHFKYNNLDFEHKYSLWGKFEVWGKSTHCYIFPQIFEKFVQELGFSDSTILINELKKLDLIKHDKEKNKTKKVIYSKDEQEYRKQVLGDRPYSSRGDYVVCIVYKENIFSGFEKKDFSSISRPKTTIDPEMLLSENDETIVDEDLDIEDMI